MAGLVPAIHVLFLMAKEDMDARDKPGHDGLSSAVFALQGEATLLQGMTADQNDSAIR
jgi:hypothetical protein